MELISTTNKHPVQITALAAETCYASYGKHIDKENEYVKKVIKSGHTSVMEHWWATFLIGHDEFMQSPYAVADIINKPGVIYIENNNGAYVTLNWRHLYEIKHNFFILKMIELIEQNAYVRLQ